MTERLLEIERDSNSGVINLGYTTTLKWAALWQAQIATVSLHEPAEWVLQKATTKEKYIYGISQSMEKKTKKKKKNPRPIFRSDFSKQQKLLKWVKFTLQ